MANPEVRHLCCYLSVPLLNSALSLLILNLNLAFIKKAANTIAILGSELFALAGFPSRGGFPGATPVFLSFHLSSRLQPCARLCYMQKYKHALPAVKVPNF